MYIPSVFRMESLAEVHAQIRTTRLANLVTMSAGGLEATPLPFMLDAADGQYGTLYAHLAKANPQWRSGSGQEALVIFMGADAYVTPSWYPGKQRDGRVVPTWNYVAVQAYGPVEFFEDEGRLLDVVTRLTRQHEERRDHPWAVGDAPPPFVAAQMRAIVGIRIPITRLEGKRKLSQNRSPEDRAGVKAGLGESECAADRAVAAMTPA